MSVLVAVPVLDRPERVWPLADSLAASIRETFCHLLFVASPGDVDEIEAIRSRQETLCDIGLLVVDWEPGHGDWAKKINAAYRAYLHPWIFTGADDLRFHPGWADEAIKVAEAASVGVVGTNDLGNPRVKAGRHATHSLVSRRYADEEGTVDGPGAVVSEAYRHNFVDDELVGTARARREYAFASDSHVEHLHPHWQKGEMDATYEKGLAGFATDRMTFQSRRRRWATRRRPIR